MLLNISPFLTILILSFAVSIATTLIYKYTTNQKVMAAIKEEIDLLRKELRETKDTKKMGEINSRMMEQTMKQFRASMKPMLITMLPALLLLGWMQANVAYQNIMPGEEFTTTARFEKSAGGEIELTAPEGVELLSPAKQAAAEKVEWKLKAKEGVHELQYKYGEEIYTMQAEATTKWSYMDTTLEKPNSFLGIKTGDAYPIKADSRLTSIHTDNKPVRPLGSISIFGWHPGWLATYITLSLIFSIALRQLLKVH